MAGAKAAGEGLVGFERAIVPDHRRQGLAFEKVPGGMLVAGRFRTLERVVDHGPPQQGRGQRVPALDLARHRIQQIVGVAVDLGSALEHELSGVGRVGPLMEEVQRRREAPEAEGVLHGPVLGLDVLKVRQLLQVGTQALGGKSLLERRPAELLGALSLAIRVKCIDVDLLPDIIMTAQVS